SAFFTYAMKAQLCDDNPVRRTESPINPRARQRKRRLDDRELALVWRAADRFGYPFGTAVQLLVLTRQRRSGGCKAPWSEFKLNNRQWIIAAERAKNNSEHLVPLSDAAIDLINGLPLIAGSDLLFTTNGRVPINDFSRWKPKLDAIITELNGGTPLPHWVLH